MPLGSALKSTIEIDFTKAQGANSTGWVTFKPKRLRVGSTMISSDPVRVKIENGVGSVELVRLLFGTYHVREEIDGRPPYEFDFSLPLSAAPVINYEEIAQVSPVPIVYTAVRSVNGVLPNPTTGDVPVEGTQGPQGPPGADGEDGAQGIQGLPGADGEQGPAGPPGFVFPLHAYSSGWHSASVNLDDARDNGAIGEAWLMRVFVLPGKAIESVGTWLKSVGVLGAGGENGFVIYNDACTVEYFRIDDETLWTTAAGAVNALLGASAIPVQGSEIAYRVGINVRGMSTSPDFPFVALPASFSEGAQKRCRFGGSTFPSVPFDPLTFGSPVGGYIPFVALGD